jgi:hypothetical protein
VSVLQRAQSQLQEAQAVLDDPDLETEVAFSTDLLELMRRGATQESFYGGF